MPLLHLLCFPAIRAAHRRYRSNLPNTNKAIAMTSSANYRPRVAATNAPPSSTTSDKAVRTALVESYGRFRRYLRKRFGVQSEAEEVLQAFMLRALERSADLRDVNAVRGWLSRILATTMADFHRQRSRAIKEVPFTAELNDRLVMDPSPEADHEICECLHQHLALLTTEQAQIIKRIDLADEPRELVALELGVTVNNITVRLHRARQALKGHLEEMCEACPEESYFACRCDEVRRKDTSTLAQDKGVARKSDSRTLPE
jgi:RNA polymerase sigma factor (sigma-70 family)